MSESSIVKEAKFLIKELIARLNIMKPEEHDEELNQLLFSLHERI